MGLSTGMAVLFLTLVSTGLSLGAPAETLATGVEHTGPPTNPLADNALRPRIIPPTPSAYESAPKDSLTTWVAKVNGDPISLHFFTRRLAANRAATYRHFAEAAGPTPGADFWTTEYQGKTPRAWLVERTLEECLRLQLELGLGKRHGLLPDTSYASFLKALDRENERRRAALAKGEPIYGPQQYGEDEFFTYVLNNLRLNLQRQLAEGELKPSEEDLQQLYESVKHEYFDRGSRVRVWEIRVHMGGREGFGETLSLEQARARIEEAKRRLDQGETFEEVAADYNDNGSLHEQVFDDTTRSMNKMQAGVREAAMRLDEGEIGDIVHEMNTFSILECLEKDPLGYRPFAEVRDQLLQLALRRNYDALLSRLRDSATVKVNQATLTQLEVR